MPKPLCITAIGMSCPVGLYAQAACAAIRAGIVRFQELPYQDNKGRAIVGSCVASLPFSLQRRERLVGLLALALEDGLRQTPSLDLQRTPLIVGVAEPGSPGGEAALTEDLIARVEFRLQRHFHPRLSRVLAKGNTAGFHGLDIARQVLQRREAAACIVCGVDSLINANALLWLGEHLRLKTEDESDGIIPGEAAACVILEPYPGKKQGTLAMVRGVGFGHEEASLLSDEPLRAAGLAGAARAALADAGLSMHELDFRLSDAVGEHYGFKEQTLAMTRLLSERKEHFPLWLSAETLGEIGAAAGLCQLVLAARAFQRGYAPGPKAICCTSSLLGDRAVAIMERAE
ncbi:3-oxoacyl-[acyl-carrier-protein] synthase-1 [Archangium gephyra]|uniref:3-oxoacyl-[acyl-carrier-protein] synthase-1 n=1 Tax=Archangium gephyra TaxID=48 RepID=A0ABX9JRY8_9BACT|nr:hypothetical protein [Archangium gephyra]REG25993.1 3-oxoacyl-[acyl-carrier-protein] synthase-1 [Archangium gephyra]